MTDNQEEPPRQKFNLEKAKITDWIVAIFTIFAFFVGIFVIYQNSDVIRTTKDTFQLSIVPTLGIEYPSIHQPNNFIIQNTSPVTLKDIEIYKICYFITVKEPREILVRTQSGAGFEPNKVRLESMKKFDFSAKTALSICDMVEIPEGFTEGLTVNKFFALVIVFHREIDNKRFVQLEVFNGEMSDDGTADIIPIYAHRRSGSSGKPNGLVQSLEFIEQTEKAIFRTKD